MTLPCLTGIKLLMPDLNFRWLERLFVPRAELRCTYPEVEATRLIIILFMLFWLVIMIQKRALCQGLKVRAVRTSLEMGPAMVVLQLL